MDVRGILTAASLLFAVALVVHGRAARATGGVTDPALGAVLACIAVLGLIWLPTSWTNWIIPLLVAFVVAVGGGHWIAAAVVFVLCEGVAWMWPKVPIILVGLATLLGMANEIAAARARRRRLDGAPRLDPSTPKGQVVAVRGRVTWPLESVPGREDVRAPFWYVDAGAEKSVFPERLVVFAGADGQPLALVDTRGAQVELITRREPLRGRPNVRKVRHAIVQLDREVKPHLLQWMAVIPPGAELEAHGPVSFEMAPPGLASGYRDGTQTLPVLRGIKRDGGAEEKVWLTDLSREAIAVRLRHTALAWGGWGAVVAATAIARALA